MKTGMMRAAALPLLLIAAQAAAQQDPIAFATGNMSDAVKATLNMCRQTIAKTTRPTSSRS